MTVEFLDAGMPLEMFHQVASYGELFIAQITRKLPICGIQMHLQSMRAQVAVSFEAPVAHRTGISPVFIVDLVVVIEICRRDETFAAGGAYKGFFVFVLSRVDQKTIPVRNCNMSEVLRFVFY